MRYTPHFQSGLKTASDAHVQHRSTAAVHCGENSLTEVGARARIPKRLLAPVVHRSFRPHNGNALVRHTRYAHTTRCRRNRSAVKVKARMQLLGRAGESWPTELHTQPTRTTTTRSVRRNYGRSGVSRMRHTQATMQRCCYDRIVRGSSTMLAGLAELSLSY